MKRPSRSGDEEESDLAGTPDAGAYRSPSAPPVVEFLPSIVPRAPTIPPPALAPRAARPPSTSAPDAAAVPDRASSATPETAAHAIRPEADPHATFEVELAREILARRALPRDAPRRPPDRHDARLPRGEQRVPRRRRALLHGKFDRRARRALPVRRRRLRVPRPLRDRAHAADAASGPRRRAATATRSSRPASRRWSSSTTRPSSGPCRRCSCRARSSTSSSSCSRPCGSTSRLCAFTGLVAAVEYAAVALFWGSADTRASREPVLTSLPQHLAKACILLVAGVAAGFVAERLRRSFTRAIESRRGARAHPRRLRPARLAGGRRAPRRSARTTAKSELRDVCVMFLDIRGFTSFAEKQSPEEVVDYLNTIFDATVDAVDRAPRHRQQVPRRRLHGRLRCADRRRRQQLRRGGRGGARCRSRASSSSSPTAASRRRASGSGSTPGPPSSATSARLGARSTPSSATS